MAMVDGYTGKVNSAKNFIKNPFKANVKRAFDGPDFADGFVINEIESDGSEGDSVVLIGNMLPKDKLKYGGSQRIKKEFYSGYSEPSMQVFGPEETDLTITGKFKDKKYSDLGMKGVSLEIAQQIDAIRIRGNVVRIRLGEFERYGIILRTDFEMFRTSNVDYSITFSIIGFNAPKNAIFIQKNKEFPFSINKDLIAQAADFESQRDSIPDSVPRSINEQLNDLINEVAAAINVVTDFVDTVVKSAGGIGKSVTRAKGLIKHAQNKIKNYKKIVGTYKPFDETQALTGRYENAKFYAKLIRNSAVISRTMQQLKNQLNGISSNLPLGRHLVRQDDTLQKIAIKFYGNADNWKKIYDFNNLTSTQLVNGRLLNIPRL